MSTSVLEPEPLTPADTRPAVEPRAVPLSERMGPGRFPGIWKPLRSAFWSLHLAFGTACLVFVLALVAAIPGLNILVLGYLVVPQRRVAETGRLRDGFPLMVLAPRLGVICFCTLLLMIPLRLLATRVSDAAVILGNNHAQVQGMLITLRILQWGIAVHVLLAIARGGRLSCFLRPIKNVLWMLRRVFTPQGRSELETSITEILEVVQPVQHFWIGLKAFFGAVIWLIIPTGLLVAYSAPGRTQPVFGLLSVLGVILLIPVAAWLPLLQVHQAVTGRFRSIFNIRAARRVIRHAPIAWALTTILMYVMTFPLYLSKIVLLPADALLIITPVFIVLTYPARILVAWAYHRGTSRPDRASFLIRWPVKLVMIPLLAAYAGFLFLTPFVSELGKAAPLENQAFLSPVPYAQWGR